MTVSGFQLYDRGEFPVAVPGSGRIQGEGYRIPRELLVGELDRVEGFPHSFDRKQVPVDGNDFWIYYSENVPPGSEVMESATWTPSTL